MVESPQKIYIHDSFVINENNDGDIYEVSLNTRGETPQGVRERLYKRILDKGVDPALLHDKVGSDIGKVDFTEDKIESVELENWVFREVSKRRT